MQNTDQAPILASLGIKKWNDMQQATHEAMAKHNEVLLLAPTGSGKTLAYLLPILQHMNPRRKSVQCLVLVPSRELALQIEQVWQKMSTGYKVNSFYGGHPLHVEMQNLSTPPALLVGTPGRITEHINRDTFELGGIHTLVLDEFDKSLEFGFEGEMSFIIGKLKHIERRYLISATKALEIPEFTKIADPFTLDFTEAGNAAAEGLDMRMVLSPERDSINTLGELLCYIGGESTIIFCNHRESTERTVSLLKDLGIAALAFHGGMEQLEREQTLVKFKNGTIYFLVATDLAARGLDMPEVKHIIHYHLPNTKEEFVHRNGRTARMHATGTSYIVVREEDKLPDYIETTPEQLELTNNYPLPPAPEWTTIFISGGKKDKVNKVDIVGFFCQVGMIQKQEIGLIDVKDYVAFVAVKKQVAKQLVERVRNEKLKGKAYKIAVAR